MSLQKQIAAISQKIDVLKAQQLELEKSISSQLFDLIKSVDGFSVPFPTLVGAIIEAIEKSKTDLKKSEE